MDNQNFPICEDAKQIVAHFASKEVFSAYNSWYLSNGIPKSQDIHFSAFDLTFKDAIFNMFSIIISKYFKPLKRFEIFRKFFEPSLGVKKEETTLKNRERLNTIPVSGKLSLIKFDRPRSTVDDTLELPF